MLPTRRRGGEWANKLSAAFRGARSEEESLVVSRPLKGSARNEPPRGRLGTDGQAEWGVKRGMARVATIRGCMRTHLPPLPLSLHRGTQVENRARIFSFVILMSNEKSVIIILHSVRESLITTIRDATCTILPRSVIIYIYNV